MKKYISYLTCALAVVLAAGCIKVDIQHYSASTVAKLHLKNTDLVETRANGIEGLNENYIGTIQCFFSVGGTAVDYATGVIDVNQNDTGNGVEYPLDIPSDVLEDLFPNGATTCNLYVLANAPAVGQVATIDAIKSTVITLSKDENGALKEKQDSFVMDGSTTVTKNNDNTLKGTVNLARAAAKIEVDLKVDKQIVIGEGDAAVTWTPDLANVKITYNQSVTASTVNAEPANASARASYAQTAQPFTFTTADALTYSTGVQKMPFYSYPSQWADNKDATAANILLEIPWKKATETQYQTYRYQIPVNFDDMKLLRNHIYKLSINVGILGALNGEVEITPSYIVVDWKSHTINTELSRPQYLVVDQNYVVMNNVEEISVGYASSDAVAVEIIESTITGFSYNSNGKVTSGTAVYAEHTAELDGNKVVFSHQLDNTRDDYQYDYLVQEVVVRIYHKTSSSTTAANATIYEEITFVQYPAMYVTSYGLTSSTVFINGSSSGGSSEWYYVRGSASASANHYTITVSAFDESTSNYQICDPREASNNNNFTFYNVDNGINGTVRSTATDAANDNTLTGYRGTITGSAAENMVAPQFMFASSFISNYGGDQSLTVGTSARYRCAGYQEYGYPAGRWRIPTPGELNVIGKLCAEGKVESIFVNGATYMSSNGPYTFSSSNGTFTKSNSTTSGTMRCVYDTWYWKDKCANVNQFIWGAEGDIANGAKSNYLVSVE